MPDDNKNPEYYDGKPKKSAVNPNPRPSWSTGPSRLSKTVYRCLMMVNTIKEMVLLQLLEILEDGRPEGRVGGPFPLWHALPDETQEEQLDS